MAPQPVPHEGCVAWWFVENSMRVYHRVTEEIVDIQDAAAMHFSNGWGYVSIRSSGAVQWLKQHLNLILAREGDAELIHCKQTKTSQTLEERRGKRAPSYFKAVLQIGAHTEFIENKCHWLTMSLHGAYVWWETPRFDKVLPNATQTLGKRFERWRKFCKCFHVPGEHFQKSTHALQCKKRKRAHDAAKSGEPVQAMDMPTSVVTSEEPTISTVALLLLLASGVNTIRDASQGQKARAVGQAISNRFCLKSGEYDGVFHMDLVLDESHIGQPDCVLAGVEATSIVRLAVVDGVVSPNTLLPVVRASKPCSDGPFMFGKTHVFDWLVALVENSDFNWLTHQVLMQLASFFERSWGRCEFTADPLAADFNTLCTKTGRSRRLDSDLLHATLELVRSKSARSSRVALSVMKAVARRKGRFFADDRHSARTATERWMHTYLMECNRLFTGANRVHMAFDGVTVAGDKLLNVVIGAQLKESTPLLRIGTKVWFWAPPQVTVVVAFSGTSVAYRRCKRATIVISIVAQSPPYQMCHYRNPCHQCHSLRQFVHDHRHKQAQG